MKKGEKILEAINNQDLRLKHRTLKERYLLLLECAHEESKTSFGGLEGLTWPEGYGVLISKDRQKIEESFSSAVVEKIPQSPYFAEVGHSKTELKRLIEMILRKLDYPVGIRNQSKGFIEPLSDEDRLYSYSQI